MCLCVWCGNDIAWNLYVQMCVRESVCVGLKLMPSVFLGLCVLLTKAGSLTGSTACQLYLATQLLWWYCLCIQSDEIIGHHPCLPFTCVQMPVLHSYSMCSPSPPSHLLNPPILVKLKNVCFKLLWTLDRINNWKPYEPEILLEIFFLFFQQMCCGHQERLHIEGRNTTSNKGKLD